MAKLLNFLYNRKTASENMSNFYYFNFDPEYYNNFLNDFLKDKNNLIEKFLEKNVSDLGLSKFLVLFCQRLLDIQVWENEDNINNLNDVLFKNKSNINLKLKFGSDVEKIHLNFSKKSLIACYYKENIYNTSAHNLFLSKEITDKKIINFILFLIKAKYDEKTKEQEELLISQFKKEFDENKVDLFLKLIEQDNSLNIDQKNILKSIAQFLDEEIKVDDTNFFIRMITLKNLPSLTRIKFLFKNFKMDIRNNQFSFELTLGIPKSKYETEDSSMMIEHSSPSFKLFNLFFYYIALNIQNNHQKSFFTKLMNVPEIKNKTLQSLDLD